MQKFKSYESEYLEITKDIKTKIDGLSKLPKNVRANETMATEKDIKEAEKMIGNMMLSVRTIPNNGELTAKIQSYEKEVKGFKMAISSSKQQAAQFDREELMNGGGFTTLTITGTDTLDDQKKSLLVGREKLDKSSRVLKSALSEAHDTVTVGITTLETMDEQTKRLGGINDKIGGINDQLYRAKKIMQQMSRRMIANKVIVFVIILVLLGAIALIIYIKFGGGSGDLPTPTPPPPPTSSPSTTGA